MVMTMTGKGFEVDSDFLHVKKCARRCDWISELPNEIISHVMSFLPLKEAVATSILSTRWSTSWKYTPNLVFVDDPYDEDPMIKMPIFSERPKYWNIERSLKNAEWVNSVLNSYKALSLKQLTISFLKTFHHVSEWLRFAFSRRVESLKLNFQFAESVLDINTLSPIKSSDYRFLRELTLESLYVSGEAIEFLLRSCSVLEGLIIKAILTSDVVIGGTLKYLEIYPRYEFCNKIIKVSASNLTRLLIYHCRFKNVFFQNVPNLVDASFKLLLTEDTMDDFANEAAGLEILAITLNQPEVFPVPKMPKLKKLVLDYADVTKTYLLPVTHLLEASPYLEEFKLEISDVLIYFLDGLTNKAIFKIPKHGRFQHDHLKVFEFSGFCHKAADNVALVRYIVNSCVALNEIVITPIYAAVARQFRRRFGIRHPFLYEDVDKIAEEKVALDMKKSTKEVFAGEIHHPIKLTIK